MDEGFIATKNRLLVADEGFIAMKRHAPVADDGGTATKRRSFVVDEGTPVGDERLMVTGASQPPPRPSQNAIHTDARQSPRVSPDSGGARESIQAPFLPVSL